MRKIISFLLVAFCLVGCSNFKDLEVALTHPEWSYRSVVYEMNIRQYTPQGTFKAAMAELPRLKALGVDVVWLMPIHPIGKLERKGHLGSYYAISDYKRINPEFGTMADFDAFVAKAHSLGLRVILDLVANHTSPDAVWTKEHKDWYVLDSLGQFKVEYDWTDIAKLNYDNPEMRQAMIDVMSYWVNKGVDGYRCDMAFLVPQSFWSRAIDTLRTLNPELYMLAEGEESWLHEAGFDATYSWELHHLMNDVAQGKKGVADLKGYLAKNDSIFPNDAFRLMFTSNHDENSWSGSEFERMGGAAPTFAALCYVLPQGQPLIYTGQEVGFSRRLPFFEKDQIDSWKANQYTDLYTRLDEVRHQNAALASGNLGGAMHDVLPDDSCVWAFTRRLNHDVVLSIFNLSSTPTTITINNDMVGKYNNAMSNGLMLLSNGESLSLNPWEFYILIGE